MPIDVLALSAAFLSGLLGGVHCVAMCGGIAVGAAASMRAQGRGPALRAALALNLGRVGGYALGGALAGGFGALIVQAAQAPWLVVGLRSAVGAVLVLAALRLLDRKGRLAFLGRSGDALWRRLAPLTRRLLPATTLPRRLALGALWGWLPCGLSSTLLLAAWFSASALHGALIMAAFGIGTLAVMVPVTWSGASFARRLAQPGMRYPAAALILVAGVLTLAGPWLADVPAMHALLEALGCRSLPVA